LINTTDSAIKIYSKNGNASGYISDLMFFQDDKNKVKYFLSISIYNASKKYYIKRRAHYSSPGIDFFRQISKILNTYVKENN
jgi:ribosomal protein S8